MQTDSSTEAPATDALSFRMAEPHDTPHLIALLNQAFRTPMDQLTWEWFTTGNPYGPSRVYVATEADRSIAGIFGFAPLRVSVEGVSVTGAYVHHLVLTPERRDGLSFVALSRHALKEEASRGLAFAIGPPNRQSYPIHKTLMKWTDLAMLDCLYKRPSAAREHGCRELTLFDGRFERFYASVSRNMSFALEKSANWMNWRFLNRPGAPYTAYALEDGQEMAGYVVLKRWQDSNGYRKAHILDLHGRDQEALSHLLAAAESYAAGSDELNLWAIPGYPYRNFLESLGFAPRMEARQPMIVRGFNGSGLKLPAGPCCLSYGDGDCQY